VGSLLGQLLPTAILAALAPSTILVVVTLLMSKGGKAKAVGFATALVAVFAVIGAVTLVTSRGGGGSGSKGSAVTGTILAVLGVLFVLIAIKQLLHAPDPDAPPPKLMSMLDTMSPVRATGFGAVLALVNFKQLGMYVGGIALIVDADVSTTQRWVALIILLVVVQIGVIAPVAVYLVAREWATRQLLRVRAWLVLHNRIISIVFGLVIGVGFTVKGFVQLA
jgi:hypothetical protein